MRHVSVFAFSALLLSACGGGTPAESPADASGESSDGASATDESTSSAGPDGDAAESGDDNTFQLKDSDTARDAHGETESKIKATATEAAMKFFVIDRNKDDAPISGIVISMTDPEGNKFYTNETDSKGYAEVLVPIGKEYDLVYLSLGREDITAKVPVKDLPNQNIKLTLRYKGWTPKERPDGKPLEPAFVLDGVTFDSGKAKIKPESFERLDRVAEYLKYKKSAKIEISGHTDNVGNPANNKDLSLKRAQACKKYLVDKGIDESRITAVGYGDEQPVASNDTPQGRAQNRRIEAKEL